jgi:hypothetical protein
MFTVTSRFNHETVCDRHATPRALVGLNATSAIFTTVTFCYRFHFRETKHYYDETLFLTIFIALQRHTFIHLFIPNCDQPATPMHSNYSTNARNMEEHFTKKATFSANGDILPTIDERAIMEGTHFLEDMETILEGATSVSMTALDEYLTKPRACRDLTALMPDNDREDLLRQPTPRLGLRRRLETYLEEEMIRAYQAELAEDKPEEESNEADKAARCKSAAKEDNSNESPIVWVIQPVHNKDGTLRFKFSTDDGACLILKDKETLESVEIMKSSSRNTFFQVYSLEGGISRIVQPDQISHVMEDIISEVKPNVDEEHIFTTNAEPETKTKKRPGQRLISYIMRRRWKTIVRRQVGIAVGDARKGAQAWAVLFPIFLIWKALSRRSR